MPRKGKPRRWPLVITALAIACVVLPFTVDHTAANNLRKNYGFGSDSAWGIVQKSGKQGLDHLTSLSGGKTLATSGANISDHDLFMLVEGAKFWIARDSELLSAAQAGKLPVSYALLDGYDIDRKVLRTTIADELASAKAIDASQPWTWPLAPVLFGLPASPDLHDIVAGVVDDDPYLAINTAGQVLTTDVHTLGFRHALTCIKEDPQIRSAEILALKTEADKIVQEVDATVGNGSDYDYVRTAFDLLSRQLSFADRDQGRSSAHDNDAYGALVEGNARCYGLSGALKLVLDARGIPNFIADGTKPSGRHSWNLLWMDGSWRVCDLTLMVDAREGDAGLSADPDHKGIYACLVLEHNFYAEHHYVLDEDCRILEEVYGQVARDLAT